MSNQTPLEYWQRGPVPDVPALLQPVAHALLQARKEVSEIMEAFPSELLWFNPFNLASCGFHLQHLSGVIDRLFTYARSEGLSEAQFADLIAEGKGAAERIGTEDLLQRFSEQVDKALMQLKATDENTLTDFRPVGRAALPSTVIGLLFHAAEHTMRHVGQLLVTAKMVKEMEI